MAVYVLSVLIRLPWRVVHLGQGWAAGGQADIQDAKIAQTQLLSAIFFYSNKICKKKPLNPLKYEYHIVKYEKIA